MPSHIENRHFAYSTRQLFDLVADVERYPEFLPWCCAARIRERGADYFIADLVIRYQHITEQYTSRVTLHPPASDHAAAAIEVALVKGPFSELENHWRFAPATGGGCEVNFTLTFRFKTKLLDTLIGGFFTRAAEKMVSAFNTRADALYGK